jgi:hypothetical protein
MGAWLLAQIATQVFPFFNVPNAAVRFVIVALVVGFPIAMVLAWIYELTPEGLVHTEDVDLATRRRFGRKIDFAIIGVLLLAAAIWARPEAARGLGGALATLAEQPFGPWLLGVVAVGLAAYGVFLLVEARYRRMVIT